MVVTYKITPVILDDKLVYYDIIVVNTCVWREASVQKIRIDLHNDILSLNGDIQLTEHANNKITRNCCLYVCLDYMFKLGRYNLKLETNTWFNDLVLTIINS